VRQFFAVRLEMLFFQDGVEKLAVRFRENRVGRQWLFPVRFHLRGVSSLEPFETA
jgi:hypothetical protein